MLEHKNVCNQTINNKYMKYLIEVSLQEYLHPPRTQRP